MGFSALVASALCTFLLPLLLFLAAVRLWDLYCASGRDPSCPLPLPPGTMGLPFFGETLQMVLQVRRAAPPLSARDEAERGCAGLPSPGVDELLLFLYFFPFLFFFFPLSIYLKLIYLF